MRNILVFAYAISPTRGSEYNVAWNYVNKMSKNNQLTVIYGISGNHMGDTEEMEEHLRKNLVPNVTFIAIKPDKFTNILNSLNRKGILIYTFYLAYKQWQKSVFKFAKQYIEIEQFDLIHYLGPIGYREPGYLWKLDLPYMWGPIGGFNNIDFKLIRATYSIRGGLQLGLRAVLNSIQMRGSNRVKKAIKRADLLLTATQNDKNTVKRLYGIDSIYFPENGLDNIAQKVNTNKFFNDTLHFVWIGTIDSRKALIFLLKALTKIDKNSSIVVHIVGDGNLSKKMKKYAINNDINHFIEWHGNIPRIQVFDIINNSHLHIITSLTEANTTVIWEAMSLGVPTMTVDHCGMHDIICEKCGIKIPVNNYEQIVDDIADKIKGFITKPSKLKKLSEGVLKCAEQYTWEKRVDAFNFYYEQAINNYEKNHR
jgi:glycosyltransferase involved in cell wall biosynthesis